MKKNILGAFLLAIGIASGTTAQNDFEAFKNAQKESLTEFKEGRNKAYADYLRKSWEEFNIEAGLVPPIKLKPSKPALAPQDTIVGLVNPDLQPVILPKINPKISPQLKLNPPNQQALSVEYYGHTLGIYIQKENIPSLKSSEQNALADFWLEFAQQDNQKWMNNIKEYKTQLQLNDWSLYLLVKKIAKKLELTDNQNVAFMFFALNQVGLNAKVGQLEDASWCLLLPVKQQLYQMSFVNIDNQKYYVMTQKSFQKIYTFEGNYHTDALALNMIFKTIPFTQMKEQNKERDLSFVYQNQRITVKIPYQTNLIDLYNDMPLADLKIFFEAPLSAEATTALQEQFTPYLKGKNEHQVADFLLSFVQKAFDYQKDGEQFGREKFFFADELFAYPYCDCEDRSILYAYLIKIFLNRKVIGIKYADHVATAVHFGQEPEGSSLKYNNKAYTLCDPTYIGATIGMAMPKYQNMKFEIIALD